MHVHVCVFVCVCVRVCVCNQKSDVESELATWLHGRSQWLDNRQIEQHIITDTLSNHKARCSHATYKANIISIFGVIGNHMIESHAGRSR